MAADRRTLLVAGAAMVGLVVLGVVSGALFARSACDTIAPEPIAVGEVLTGAALADTGSAAAVTGALGDLAPEDRVAVEDAVGELEQRVGPVRAVAALRDVDRLAAVDGGVAALGGAVRVLEVPEDGPVVARGAVSLQEGLAVGDGAHLYSLAITNPLTGQVDALQPLDGELEGMTCVDTALVGSPLAFHLDAGDGELLLLRIEEDGEDPELELRDPVAGRRWAAELALPTAPAGLAGARLTGRLGPDAAVVATRTAAEDEVAVVTAVERSDGSPRWRLDRDELRAAGVPLPAAPVRAEVAALGTEVVVVGMREVDGDGRADEEAEQDARARGAHRLVLLDAATGRVLGVEALAPGERVAAATADGARAELVVTDLEAGGVRLVELSPAGLDEVVTDALGAPGRTLAGDAEGPLRAVGRGPAGVVSTSGARAGVAALGGPLAVVEDAGAVSLPLRTIDVVSHAGGTSLLLAGEDGARVLLTVGA